MRFSTLALAGALAFAATAASAADDPMSNTYGNTITTKSAKTGQTGMLFFNADGDRAKLTANITSMLDSVSACLDLARLRNSTMSEYLLTGL